MATAYTLDVSTTDERWVVVVVGLRAPIQRSLQRVAAELAERTAHSAEELVEQLVNDDETLALESSDEVEARQVASELDELGAQVEVRTVGQDEPSTPRAASFPSTVRGPLDLRDLAVRESEQVEWKENVADVEDVVATICAFSNDWANLGGGYVVCGAAEGQDEYGFATVRTPGLESRRFKEIEGKVMALCRDRVDPPLTPRVEELGGDDPSRRVLVFVVPATGMAHSFRRGRGAGSDSGKHYIRRGRSTEEARNGLYRELLVRKGPMPPWDRRPNLSASVDDIDPLVLRDTLQRMSLWEPAVPLDHYLSADHRIAALVPALCAAEPLTKRLRPRNFALLLFGRDPLRFTPGAHVVFSRYPGPDRSERYSDRQIIAGPVLQQIRTLKELLEEQARGHHDKAATESHFSKYPMLALEEAMINALVHRDYELDEPVRITVFSDRIEIVSPGGLNFQVKPELFLAGKATAAWRNQALTWLLYKLDLVESEGAGIPRIMRAMRDAGCPPPQFDLESHRVRCILYANPRATRTALSLSIDAVVQLPESLGISAIIAIPGEQERPTLPRERLRAVPVDARAWQGLMRSIDEGIERALDSTRGELHVFGMAPHAAAAYLGRRLDDSARGRPIHLYQLGSGTAEWEELVRNRGDAGEPYFEALEEVGEPNANSQILLAIDGIHPIDRSRRDLLAERIGARAYHLRPRGAAPLHSSSFVAASSQLRASLARIVALHPGRTLNIITSAPLALVVELGRLLSPTIVSSAVIHHYVPAESTYVPVIDVVRRSVVLEGS